MKRKRFVCQTTVRYIEEFDEWVVKAYDQHGTRLKKADYFTDDEEDANDTAREMRLDGVRKLERYETLDAVCICGKLGREHTDTDYNEDGSCKHHFG
jgi:hypothetical protein